MAMQQNRKRYKQTDDLSDIEEVNYETLLREEKKTTQIGKLEDEREWQLEQQREKAKRERLKRR